MFSVWGSFATLRMTIAKVVALAVRQRTGATPVLTLMLLVALHSRRRLCHPQDRGTPARVLSFLSYQSGLAGHGN